TLVGNAVQQARAAGCDPVIVVTGCAAEQVAAAVADLPCRCVENKGWEAGMGTSVQAGVAALASMAAPPERVLLMVCDQSLVAGTDLRALVEAARKSPGGVAAASYGGAPGVPACLSWRYK